MNVEKHRPTIKRLFAQFYNNEISKEKLIKELYKVENSMYANTKTEFTSYGIKIRELWFRFFSGDTITTTIEDLSNDISSSVNRNYIMDKIKIAVEKPKEFQIYYS